MQSLRSTIEQLCLKRIGRAPNLETPTHFNDLIQWLKLNDQQSDQVICCDKWRVRDWVKGRAGEGVLIPASLDWPPSNLPVVAKCTHDSGSARFVRTRSEAIRAEAILRERLRRPYGIDKGEWAYRFVKPRIMVEQMLPDPIVDYKFHCSHDEPRCCFVVSDRFTGSPKATALDPDGKPTGLSIDDHYTHAPNAPVYPGNAAWAALTDLARALCKGWRYVRVDLYWSEGRAMFGELTFWPAAGCGVGRDLDRLGAMLELDLSYRNPPIVA